MTVIERLEKRRDELKTEQQLGEQRLRELQRQTDQLNATMLRIAGAIQVIEEVIAENKAPATEAP